MTDFVYFDFPEDFSYDADSSAHIVDGWLVDVNKTLDDRESNSLPVDPANYDYVYYFDGDISTFQKPWTSDEAFWPTIVTYGLTFTLGIFGNLLVVFALLLDRKSRNVTSYFLVSLALADIVFLLVCVPYETLMKMKKLWAGGPVLCKIAGFVEMLSATASVNNLMAVSIERYVVIVHPMKSRSWCTTGNTKKIILSVWLVAFLLSAPILHIMDTDVSVFYNNASYAVIVNCAEYNVRGPNDRTVFSYYQLLIMFILPVIVLVFCYTIVIHVLWRSNKELARMTQTETNRRDADVCSRQHKGHVRLSSTPSPAAKGHSVEVREARKQVIKMLLTIIAVFFLCWGPKLVLNVLKRHELKILHLDAAFYISLVINLLPYIHSCINPIIYSFMSNNFRRSLRTGCRVCSCCERRRAFFGQHPRPEFDMETKSMNGHSMYSPICATKTTARPFTTIVTDC